MKKIILSIFLSIFCLYLVGCSTPKQPTHEQKRGEYSTNELYSMYPLYASQSKWNSKFSFNHTFKDGKLLKSIQMNICDFISEIGRESEFVISNNRIQTSNEYKKEYLERLIKIEELVFVKDNDYGYHSVSTIFNNIELAKLEIRTTNKEDAVINCFNNILRAADYIINFKPHIIKTPFMNQLECTDICSYSSVLRDLKNNIIKELIDNIFKQYKNLEIYQDILGKVNEM